MGLVKERRRYNKTSFRIYGAFKQLYIKLYIGILYLEEKFD